MCRHLAYLGPPVALHQLLFGEPHSLCEQARTPQHQVSGETNPDGWGVGWYRDGDEEPDRHRTVTPIWDDAPFADQSRTIESGAFLGAARLASPGATIDPSGNAPFVSGPWLFSLNGAVGGFRKGVDDQLRAELERAAARRHRRRLRLRGAVRARPSTGSMRATRRAPRSRTSSRRVTALTKGRLNMLLTDGHQLAATRYGNSLFVRGATVVSEPLDDDADWTEVPDHSLVVVTAADGSPPEIKPL